MEKLQLYIGGEWVDGHSGQMIQVENPATREMVAEVPAGDETDVNLAVEAAQKGYAVWKNYTGAMRAECLYKLADYFEEHATEIAATITMELGAPIKMSEDWHVSAASRETRYYAELAENYDYEKKESGYILCREPVGIVAGLTPWNFPLDQVTLKLLPALAAGNSVILKPSQMAPLTSYHFVKGTIAAGFPAGVFNLVTGRGGDVGNVLASHPDIRMISFTGSTSAGRQVGKLALSNIKKIALELGGKSAAIVLESADMNAAASAVAEDCFMNTGQVCNAITRMLVPADRVAEMEELLKAEAAKYVVGDPLDPASDIGPLINEKSFYKVKEYIETGIAQGARMIVGEIPESPTHGYYVKPVVFSDVNNKMRIAQEEIFGPVLSVIPYETIEDAIAIANDSPYGLCGGVFGERAEAVEVSRKMDTGTVCINGAPIVMGAPFGGYKQSGLGRENSIDTFEEYMEIKAILVEE